MSHVFRRSGAPRPAPLRPRSLATTPLSEVMTPTPLMLSPDTSIREVARLMREQHVSSILLGEPGALAGIVTIRDMATRVLAKDLDSAAPVRDIMSAPVDSLPDTARASDVLHCMVERRITHMPVTRAAQVVGIVTQTDLTRYLADNTATLVAQASRVESPAELTEVTAGIPALLMTLVGAGNRPEAVTRLITDIADAATRRLLALAEHTLGPPPVPYLWAACGSQGRREQTGVSDQDNCLILADEVSEADYAYFHAMAEFVCTGLDQAGYVFCPGEMMATTPRWCQPLRVWQRYFQGWIARPDPEAQMLASVMFDLRAIGGDSRLLTPLQADTLAAAGKNSIFVAHMISNALKHTPPLSWRRGIATDKSGTVDLKKHGVVPVMDLARVYALRKGITAVNTRERLQAAIDVGAVSDAGGRDLLDAYDLICETRLAHQAQQVKNGEAPDHHMRPDRLSGFERSHLRNAFLVVRSMQSALGQAMRGLT